MTACNNCQLRMKQHKQTEKRTASAGNRLSLLWDECLRQFAAMFSFRADLCPIRIESRQRRRADPVPKVRRL